MRFDSFVERCLYHPEHGFYTSGAGVAGRRGDFLTSPEVGPLFGEVLARWLDDLWDRLGRPDPFVVYDAGTGPGTLTRQLAANTGQSGDAMVVGGFDRAHGEGALPGDLGGAVVIANELLDNLPFRVIEHRGGRWHELYVSTGPDGAVEHLEAVDEADEGLRTVIDRLAAADLVEGTRVPVLEGATRWVSDVLAARPAVLIAFDYGAATTVELARRGGWLRTYRQHEVGTDPLVDPGLWDITTDIPVDQLPSPTAVTDQAAFLRRWGIDGLVAEGRQYWTEHAARPDLSAFRMRSRVSEAEALLDSGGLGSWLVCIWEQDQ